MRWKKRETSVLFAVTVKNQGSEMKVKPGSFIKVHSKGGAGHSRETKAQETPGCGLMSIFFLSGGS